MAAATFSSSPASSAVITFSFRRSSGPSVFPVPAPPTPLLFLSTPKSANVNSPPALRAFVHRTDTSLLLPSPAHAQQPPRRKKGNLYLSDEERIALCGRCRRLLHIAIRHGDVELARAVHALVAKNLRVREWEGGGEEGMEEEGGGIEEETLLLNSLLTAYIKLELLSDARELFEEMRERDVVSYTCLMSAYAKCGQEEEAVNLFTRMRCFGVSPNAFSFVAVVTSCIRQPNSRLGMQLHNLVVKSADCHSNVHVWNALIGFYVVCGRLDYAIVLFEEMVEKDVTSWNTIISGMVKDGRYDQALQCFQDMRLNGLRGDSFTLSSLLTATVEGFSWSAYGETVHSHALKIGLELDLSVANSLIAFYTKFGSAEDAFNVFHRMPSRDVISWNAMIRGYMVFGLVESALDVFDRMPTRNSVSYNVILAGFCQNDESSQALYFFKQMLESGIELSDFTLTSVINACALYGETKTSVQIHAFVLKVGCGGDSWVKAALLDMCTKCERIEDAQKMFQQWDDKESHRIAWTSLICGLAKNGQPNEAISLFSAIQKEKDLAMMDEVTLTTVLGVCGFLGFSEMGKQIHCYIQKSMDSFDVKVGNAIFSMYSKCGELKDAIKYFDQMPERDLVTWNALITTHLLHQQGDEALSVWKQMKKFDIIPDHITFVLILSACKFTRSSSVDTCQNLLSSMSRSYGLIPASEHYASVVDVLGCWGHFHDAEEVIRNIPFKPDALVWRALLDSCRLHSNLSLGRECVKQILALEPRDPSTYALVSNLYAASGRWHCSETVRKEMKEKGLRKHPAQSWIIHQYTVHSFFTRDKSHPQSKDIYSALDILILECMKAGYVPDNSFVLHEVEEYQKKDFLFYHSAKLAVTYGHLVTGLAKPVRVMKNICLCGDCHAFLKCLSTVINRDIILRDSTAFHFFKSGKCSCNDCW